MQPRGTVCIYKGHYVSHHCETLSLRRNVENVVSVVKPSKLQQPRYKLHREF
jgi:hypothetical protein